MYTLSGCTSGVIELLILAVIFLESLQVFTLLAFNSEVNCLCCLYQ